VDGGVFLGTIRDKTRPSYQRMDSSIIKHLKTINNIANLLTPAPSPARSETTLYRYGTLQSNRKQYREDF